MQQNAYYKVAVTDGTIVDTEGCYVRDVIAYDCGHNHRTDTAAEACREKLLNWSKDGRECSARWYNSKVMRVDPDGRHFPPTQAEAEAINPGYCVECGAAVPGHVGAGLCPTCQAKYADAI